MTPAQEMTEQLAREVENVLLEKWNDKDTAFVTGIIAAKLAPLYAVVEDFVRAADAMRDSRTATVIAAYDRARKAIWIPEKEAANSGMTAPETL